MGVISIPVRLTLAESCAVALHLAAQELSAAANHVTFLAALDSNHRLWMSLVEIAQESEWGTPDRRLADFVVATSHKAGRKTGDDLIETLITINREMAARLAGGQDVEGMHRRAILAWQERGRPYGQALERWLVGEMERKARIRH